jgi:hypothetical protein
MSISVRIAAAGILALVTAGDARGELVTFRFEGRVSDVAIDIPEYWGTPNINWPSVGTSFSGFYTFDSTAKDTSMAAEQGSYHTVLQDATAVDVSVGELNLQGAASFVATYASIYQAGDWIPSLELVSHPADADLFNRNNFQLSIRKEGLLPGPILPLTPPSLIGAEEAKLFLWLDSGYNTRPWPYVSIVATLDSLELAEQMSGDFDANGVVDAADYMMWRKSDGSQAGYDMWRTNYGRAAQSTASSSGLTTVPEPSTVFLLAIACAMGVRKRCS